MENDTRVKFEENPFTATSARTRKTPWMVNLILKTGLTKDEKVVYKILLILAVLSIAATFLMFSYLKERQGVYLDPATEAQPIPGQVHGQL